MSSAIAGGMDAERSSKSGSGNFPTTELNSVASIAVLSGRRTAMLKSTLALLMLFASQSAKAHDQVMGFHNEYHHDRLHGWYETLMRPDTSQKVSCCSSGDCTPTQAKFVDGKWVAMKAGRWIVIPQSKVNKEESIDTMAHICWAPWTKDNDDLFCFVPPNTGN